LQAIPTAAFNNAARTEIWTYRIPSFLGAFAALALMFWVVSGFASRETAFLGALILGVTLLVSAEAKIAKTDAVLLRTYLSARPARLDAQTTTPSPSRRMILFGWAMLGIGTLIKGPILPAVLAVTVTAISVADSDWRWLKQRSWGEIALRVVLFPWFLYLLLKNGDWRWLKRFGSWWGLALMLII